MVATFNAGKFAARLQAATAGKTRAVEDRLPRRRPRHRQHARAEGHSVLFDIYSFVLWCAGAKR